MRTDAAFDAEHGITTGGVEYLHDLTIEGHNARFGTNYVPSDPTEFETAMSKIDLDPSTAAFIDLGSGRGRALIMAARLPFDQIIGVEFAQELHGASLLNCRIAFPDAVDSGRITPTLGDAALFRFPDRPLVLYLYNPFDAPIMAAVARNALASWQANPRQIRVVYLNPVLAGEWSKAGWQIMEHGHGLAIFAPPGTA